MKASDSNKSSGGYPVTLSSGSATTWHCNSRALSIASATCAALLATSPTTVFSWATATRIESMLCRESRSVRVKLVGVVELLTDAKRRVATLGARILAPSAGLTHRSSMCQHSARNVYRLQWHALPETAHAACHRRRTPCQQ